MLSQLKYLKKNLHILSNSLAKVKLELEDFDSLKNSLLIPSLAGTKQEGDQKMREDNRSFELLTQQFKLLPSLFEQPKNPSANFDLEHDFIRYPCGDEEVGLKIPTISRRASSSIFSESSHPNNTLSMISKGLANTELFGMKEIPDFLHPEDAKAIHRKDIPENCIRSFNELDSFCHSLSTDFPNSLESLDNPHSKMLLQPSIIRRRASIEHQQLLPHHEQHYEDSYLDRSVRRQHSMAEPHQGSFFFPPLVTKKDTLFMIDEPIEEQYEESHFNIEHPSLCQSKNEEYLQNWPYKTNDSNH